MSRKLLSLAVLAAAFTLSLGTTDAQARHCRSHRSHHGCRQIRNYSNCCSQQAANVSNQQASYVATKAASNPQPTSSGVQPAYDTSVVPASLSTRQPSVVLGAPGPAPGN